MIPIYKKPEPHLLTTYRKTSGASYQNMHGASVSGEGGHDTQDVYSVVLDSLMKEQGYICAYCMQRISNERGKATIEHIVPRSYARDKELDYRNMVAVCNGNRDARDNKIKTCDAHRGNAKMIVNPLDPTTLSGIGYRKNGKIYSTDERINQDLDVVLNLNCMERRLPENRKAALTTFQKGLQKKYPAGDISSYCRKELERLRRSECKMPYTGVIESWLEKHI